MFIEFNPEILPKISYFGHGVIKDDFHFYRKVDEYIMYIMISGNLHIREDEENYHLKPGDYLIFEPNKEHEGTRKSSCEFYYIHFKYEQDCPVHNSLDSLKQTIIDERYKSLISNQILFDVEKVFSFIPKYYNLSRSTKYPLIKNKLDDSIEDYLQKYENYKILAACRTIEIFILIHREYINLEIDKQDSSLSQKHILINNVISYIHKNIYKKFDRKDIENEFELNYDYLNRVFGVCQHSCRK